MAIAACTRMATAGTPFLVLREKTESRGRSSPIAIVTLGPIHIMALMAETRPTQISAPTMRPPASPKICLPAISPTSIWPASLSIGVV